MHITMISARHMKKQGGATLIEVLVSILLLALGVLAMAAMQANAVQYGKTSEFRSLATLLASDLADRMRANAGPDMSAYNLTAPYARPTAPPDAAPQACDVSHPCTPAEMTAFDLAQWRRNVYNQLPEGTAYVSASPVGAAPATVDIWIAWTDPAGASGTENTPRVDSCPSTFKQPDQVRCMYFHIVL